MQPPPLSPSKGTALAVEGPGSGSSFAAGQNGLMLVAFSIAPSGTGDASVGDAVAEAVRIVRASGLPNETTSMFTTLEGEWDEVMAVIKDCVDALAASAPRVSLVLKADIRPGYTGQLRAKVKRVEDALATTGTQPGSGAGAR